MWSNGERSVVVRAYHFEFGVPAWRIDATKHEMAGLAILVTGEGD